MSSVNKYLICGSVKQYEEVSKWEGDGKQIMYMRKATIHCARREHAVMQKQLGRF